MIGREMGGVRGVITDIRKRHATEDNIRGTSAVGDMETLETKDKDSITLRCSGAKTSRQLSQVSQCTFTNTTRLFMADS
jgi:hypothetical protein